MSKLSTVCDIVWTEQDADIADELGLPALLGMTRPAGLAVFRQVPPELLIQIFLLVDLAVVGFLLETLFYAFVDHAVAGLLERSTC